MGELDDVIRAVEDYKPKVRRSRAEYMKEWQAKNKQHIKEYYHNWYIKNRKPTPRKQG